MSQLELFDTLGTLRSEYDRVHMMGGYVAPSMQIGLRLAFLSAEERIDLNLSSHYCLQGDTDLVRVFLKANHPMSDLFDGDGRAIDEDVVRYVRRNLELNRLRSAIQKLEGQFYPWEAHYS